MNELNNYFDKRAIRALNSIFVYNVSDFENMSLDNLRMVDGVGYNTFKKIEQFIRDNNITTLDDKLNELLIKKSRIANYIFKNRAVNQHKDNSIQYRQDLKFVRDVQKEFGV
jgi:hypothetical protein